MPEALAPVARATAATAARMAGTWRSAAFEPGSPAVRAALNRTVRPSALMNWLSAR
jgi:hypothetical protein